MASYASPVSGRESDYDFSSTPGQLVSSGLGTLTELAKKYPNNEIVGNLAVGGIADVGKTQANTGLAVAYNDAFLGSLQRFAAGDKRLNAELTKEMLSTETALDSKREKETMDRTVDAEDQRRQNDANRINRYANRQFA